MIPCFRHRIHPQNFYRHRWFRILQTASLFIGHGTNTAPALPCQNTVTYVKCTIVYQDIHDRTSALIQLSFDNYAVGFTVRVGFQFFHFRYQQDVFQQVIEPDSLLSGNRNHNDIAAPVFGNKAFAGQFFLNVFRVGAWLINLVNSYHNRNLCRLRMVDSFHSLRHNAIISRYNDDRNIGNLRTAGSHSGKRFVARGIQEGNLLVLIANLISTDSLSNSARFMKGYIGRTQCIQQCGLTMVYMAHDGNYRRTQLKESRIIRFRSVFGKIFFLFRFQKGNTKFISQNFHSISVQVLVDCGHNAISHKVLDDFAYFTLQQIRKFLDSNCHRNSDFGRINYRLLFLRMFLLMLLQGTGHERSAFTFSAALFIIFLCFLTRRSETLLLFRLFRNSHFHRGRRTLSHRAISITAALVSVLTAFAAVISVAAAVSISMIMGIVAEIRISAFPVIMVSVSGFVTESVVVTIFIAAMFRTGSSFFPSMRRNMSVFCLHCISVALFLYFLRLFYLVGRVGTVMRFICLSPCRSSLSVKTNGPDGSMGIFSRFFPTECLFQKVFFLLTNAVEVGFYINIVFLKCPNDLFIRFPKHFCQLIYSIFLHRFPPSYETTPVWSTSLWQIPGR